MKIRGNQRAPATDRKIREKERAPATDRKIIEKERAPATDRKIKEKERALATDFKRIVSRDFDHFLKYKILYFGPCKHARSTGFAKFLVSQSSIFVCPHCQRKAKPVKPVPQV